MRIHMVSLLISPVIRLMNSKMTKTDYLKLLVDEIHSTTVATIGADGHPQTRIIDMMYYDKEGIYFLTAKGKEFYAQLMEQQYVAISATKEKIAISLRGKVQNIGKKNLDIMFEKNPYMKDISGRYERGNRSIPVVINQKHCLHCGRCAQTCPKQCVKKRG